MRSLLAVTQVAKPWVRSTASIMNCILDTVLNISEPNPQPIHLSVVLTEIQPGSFVQIWQLDLRLYEVSLHAVCSYKIGTVHAFWTNLN